MSRLRWSSSSSAEVPESSEAFILSLRLAILFKRSFASVTAYSLRLVYCWSHAVSSALEAVLKDVARLFADESTLLSFEVLLLETSDSSCETNLLYSVLSTSTMEVESSSVPSEPVV